MEAEIRTNPRFAAAATRLSQLCAFTGSEEAFWNSCLTLFAEVAGAQAAIFYRAEEEPVRWHARLALPAELLAAPNTRNLLALGAQLAPEGVKLGFARRALKSGQLPGEVGWLLAMGHGETTAIVLLLGSVTETQLDDVTARLRLVAHVPSLFSLQQTAARAEVAVGHFASVLDLASLLNSQRRFLASGMTLCNELASRHQCDRISLGWLKGEYVRLRAMSNSEKFERRMESVQQLEAVMEESLDQDEPVVWPAPAGQRLVTRDIEAFAEAQRVRHVAAIPLRSDGGPVAVLVCERNAAPFAEFEIRLLTLCGEVALRQLSDLERDDRWFGARWAAAGKDRAARLLGPRHTGTKIVALLLCGLLLWLIFGSMRYRVDAPFALRTEKAVFVTAPFNSYIDDVKVEAGAVVKKGDVLATLDTRELVAEEGNALADHDAYVRETRKAGAANKLAEMGIASARAEQAWAKLELAQLRRSQSSITAPFDGIIIEGDLKKRLGAPVRQGDVLFRIARTDQFYVECQVAESDVRELRVEGTGEVAFASQPKLTFPIRIRQIDPVAEVKPAGNVILARCDLTGTPEPWWRPGMSGVSKLDVGERSPGWILTRRTVDYLRLNLWW
jgi:GAF domain-containing protein